MPKHTSTSKTAPKTTPQKAPASRPKNSTESLNHIQSTKTKIIQIKQNLNTLVDKMHHQRSFITRTADVWGEIPAWVKIVSGILLFGIFLTIGIYAHIDILTAVTSVCAVFSIVISFALDNHHTVEKKSREQIKTNLAQLADMLGSTIEALQNICEQLTAEIAHLKSEITRLCSSIDQLEKQIEKLSTQVKQLGLTSEQLKLIQEELLSVKYALSLKMLELTVLISTLGEKVKELQEANDTFKSILSILSTQLKANEATQKLFVEQFNRLFKETSLDFAKTLAMLYTSQKELATTKTELSHCNQEYKDLLTRHEKLFDKSVHLQKRVEQFVHNKTTPLKPPVKKSASTPHSQTTLPVQMQRKGKSNRMFHAQKKQMPSQTIIDPTVVPSTR